MTYRKMLCYAVSAPALEAECPVHCGICSGALSSMKERKSKHMQGGRGLQESQKIAQEAITLPGTSNRWDFLLNMVAHGNADFTLSASFLLSGATLH